VTLLVQEADEEDFDGDDDDDAVSVEVVTKFDNCSFLIFLVVLFSKDVAHVLMFP